MEKFYRISEAANKLNISRSGLRNLEISGKIKCNRTPSGQRVFTQTQLNEFLGVQNPQKIVFYTRDSSGNTKNLENQTELLTAKYGTPDRIFTDKASGLNENRRGLKQLINSARKQEFNIIAIADKDRLTRFGYSYLEELFKDHNIKILILTETKTNNNLQEELLQDFMSLLASFSGKFYKLRSIENRKKFLNKAGEELE